MFKLTVTSVVSIAVLAFTAGCTSSSATLISGTQLPNKNLTQYVMPLDQFSYTPYLDEKGTYANALLTQPCMNKKGYFRAVPTPDLTKLAPSTTRIFDLKRVEKYGYRPIIAPGITDAWLAYLTQKFSPDEQTAYDKCDAPGVIATRPPLMDLNFVAQLSSASYTAALLTKRVKADAKKWIACMRPQGVIDLPTVPTQMPSASLQKEFGIVGDGGIQVASPAEIAIATADFKCRDKVGFTRDVYNAEWKIQVQDISKNGTRLASIQRELKAFNAKLTKIISQNPSTN
jgi:hypothetical protein